MKPILEHSFNWSSRSFKTIRWCWAYFSFFVLWLKYKFGLRLVYYFFVLWIQTWKSLIESSLSSFRTLKMWKYSRVILSSSHSLKHLKSHSSDGRLSLFQFRWTIYQKGPYGVFLCGHSDSLNMNDTKLTFIGLVKLNIERPSFGNEPLLSQVRKTYEFGLVLGWATTSVFYPLWTRKNKKRHSSTMMGKLRKGNHFANK